VASNPPVRWSVARGEGIVWKTPLPEEGQSGIAVWNDRLFLTTLKPEEGAKPKGREVVVYCLDAADGKILWSDTLPGQDTSTPAYFFSDATSPSPLTDGEHVWFFNGIDIVSDKRSQGDGWWWGYLGSPTAVGGRVYFTTMLGITYALDAKAAVLDEKALLSVNDLGTPGQTWSLNSISFANGGLYHPSMKEVVCIGK